MKRPTKKPSESLTVHIRADVSALRRDLKKAIADMRTLRRESERTLHAANAVLRRGR